MAKYRLIIVSDESGSKEDVIFADPEDDSKGTDWCSSGQTVNFDSIIEADLPGVFPVNFPLKRSY